MKQNACAIDWITASKKSAWAGIDVAENIQDATWIALRVKQELGLDEGGVTFSKSEAFYPWVFTAVEYGVQIGISNDLITQGVVVRIPGKACRLLRGAEDVLAIMADKMWRVTRLDVAFDVVGQAYDFEFVRIWAEQLCATKNRKFGYITSKSGDTVNMGSRESTTMVRFYDKAKEQGVDYPWLRVEAELKGDVAAEIASRKNPVTFHALAHMFRYLDGLNLWVMGDIERYLAHFTSKSVVARETISDRAVWMETTVASALRKWHDEEPMRARAWVAKMSSLLDTLELMI